MLGSIADADAVVHHGRGCTVIIAFTVNDHEEMLRLVRRLTALDVQIELIPRYFEVVGHTSNSTSSRAAAPTARGATDLHDPGPEARHRRDRRDRRTRPRQPADPGDPCCIKFDSLRPVLFKQVRLGESMRELTNLKFRTMVVSASDEEHRAYINATMGKQARQPEAQWSLQARSEAPRRRGSVAGSCNQPRRAPQLFNVLRGDISLVGPRPCIPYEVEHFQTHHLDRFLVPLASQVVASDRAGTITFGEALDLDVAYVRSYSIWLDLKLLRTPSNSSGSR